MFVDRSFGAQSLQTGAAVHCFAPQEDKIGKRNLASHKNQLFRISCSSLDPSALRVCEQTLQSTVSRLWITTLGQGVATKKRRPINKQKPMDWAVQKNGKIMQTRRSGVLA
jgi:hypothetical protein